jgi:hypothetical protein
MVHILDRLSIFRLNFAPGYLPYLEQPFRFAGKSAVQPKKDLQHVYILFIDDQGRPDGKDPPVANESRPTD